LKKFIAGLVAGLILATSSFVFAASPIKLIVNGQEIHPDVPPQIIDGRTLVPARALAEALGAQVTWDGVNNAVVVTNAIAVESNTTSTLKNDIIKENIEGGVSMDDLISADSLIHDYNVFMSVGEKVTLRNGDVEIIFPHPYSHNKTVEINTDLGTITLVVEKGRFYFYKSELQHIGIIN